MGGYGIKHFKSLHRHNLDALQEEFRERENEREDSPSENGWMYELQLLITESLWQQAVREDFSGKPD